MVFQLRSRSAARRRHFRHPSMTWNPRFSASHKDQSLRCDDKGSTSKDSHREDNLIGLQRCGAVNAQILLPTKVGRHQLQVAYIGKCCRVLSRVSLVLLREKMNVGLLEPFGMAYCQRWRNSGVSVLMGSKPSSATGPIK
jgi:hypothetical protein